MRQWFVLNFEVQYKDMDGTTRELNCRLHDCHKAQPIDKIVLPERPTDAELTNKLQVLHGPSKFVSLFITAHQTLNIL